jgi:peptide/nickel transport system permease protein
MGAYAARRMLQTVPVLFGVSVIVFTMLRLVPGDPAIYVAGPEATPQVLAAVRHRMGLDQPVPVQYGLWLFQALQGDFGRSFVNGIPVTQLVWQRVPATLELAAGGMLFTLLLGFPLGILAAVRRDTIWDYLVAAFSATSLGIPVYWLGILMIMLFALGLGWLPPGGRTEFRDGLVPALTSMFLPTFCLGLAHAPILTRFLRSSILDVLHEDYVRTARAKGLPNDPILRRHVLTNALIPVVTVLGIVFGRLLGGVVITEAVFAWPGMGSMIITAIGNRDYSLVQATILLVVVAFIGINLLVDLVYGFLDPRLRLGGGA